MQQFINSTNQLCLIADALKFAADQHRDQRRKDSFAAPYINHPIELMHTLIFDGKILDIDTIVGAILHDTIEDTGATYAGIAKRFGLSVAVIVDEVSDDKSLPKEERKLLQIEHASLITAKSQAVKVADKICNGRDLIRCRPVGWDDARVSTYFNWARTVVNQIRPVWPDFVDVFDDVFNQAAARNLVIYDDFWQAQIEARAVPKNC